MRFVLISFFIAQVIFTGCMPSHDTLTSENNTMDEFDLSQIPDGTFLGAYQNDGIDYQVEVTIELHQITCIKIIGTVQQVLRKKCAPCKINEIIQNIVDEQIIDDVDGVSGATQTSNAILNAIKAALSKPYTLTENGPFACD